MRYKLVAATVALVTAGVFATAAMAAGPRPSSENYVPDQPTHIALNSNAPAMMGPRASSANHIPAAPIGGLAGIQVAAAAPHYVYQQGYDHHGWHGHWVLVR